MNASKENARLAHSHVRRLQLTETSSVLKKEANDFLDSFLLACEKKLPSEATYAKPRYRNRVASSKK